MSRERMSEARPAKGSDNVPTERNRELAKRWFREVWNERKADTIDEIFSDNAIGHTENGDQNREQFKTGREQLLNAFPDMKVEIEDTAAEGDEVVVRWRVRGTHRGDSLGVQATGRPVEFRGMTWLKFREGVFVEGWDS